MAMSSANKHLPNDKAGACDLDAWEKANIFLMLKVSQ